MKNSKLPKKYRILFVHSPGHHANGPDNSLYELVSRLDQNRYEIYIAIPEYSELIEKYRPYIANLFISDDVRIVSPPKKPVLAVQYIIQSLWAIPRLARLLTDNKIDLVHSNVESTWSFGFTARIKRIPSIVHIRGLTSITGTARSKIVPVILQLVGDEFIAVSDGVAEAYQAAGLPAEKLHVVPNGVDTNKFKPGKARQYLFDKFGLPVNSMCLGAVGSADPRKGWAYLVMAFALVKKHHPNVYCFLIGNKSFGEIPFYKDHTYLEVVHGLIDSLGINESIFITGVIQDMPKVYDSLSLVVQPSLTEAGPRVVLESMAMGKPIVATRVPGNCSYLPEEEAGVFTEIKDPQSMAAVIAELLNNPDRLESMSRQGRAQVENKFSIGKQVGQIDQIYIRIIEGSFNG